MQKLLLIIFYSILFRILFFFTIHACLIRSCNFGSSLKMFMFTCIGSILLPTRSTRLLSEKFIILKPSVKFHSSWKSFCCMDCDVDWPLVANDEYYNCLFTDHVLNAFDYDVLALFFFQVPNHNDFLSNSVSLPYIALLSLIVYFILFCKKV